jgi:hypothetical protein
MISIVFRPTLSKNKNMKPQLRSILRNGGLALLGICTFSCIDQAYDLNNLDSEAVLFANSLNAPVGKATITMDSVIGGLDIDTSILKVKDNTYTFGYSGSFDIADLSSTLSNFSLATVSNSQDTILLYDATGKSPSPFPIPAQTISYESTMSISLPSFSTSLMDVEDITLQNSYIDISTSTSGLGGSQLSNCASITFTADGTGAEYYVDGVKKTSWTMNLGGSCSVEIRKVHLTSGLNTLKLSRKVTFNIANDGDVTASTTQRSFVKISISYHNGLDFSLVQGKVNYSLEGNLDPINFDALGSILSENDVLSIYNPTIVLSTKGNIGVPIKLDLNMSTSNSATGNTRSLSGAYFDMIASSSPDVDTTNTFTLDKENGTAELFKINPDQINLGYKVQSDTNSATQHFIAKDSHLSMTYKMEIPLQFGSDLNLNVEKTTLKNPLGDNLDILDDQDDLTVGLLLNIKNRIPLAMKIKLTALDKDSVELFTISTDSIDAADPIDPTTGFATGYTTTSTSIDLTPDQIDQLKDTYQFRIGFTLYANPNATFVTVQPSDYIEISIGAKVSGGVKLQLDPDELTDEDS